MDPNSALLNASGANDHTGSTDPDAVTWRVAAERVIIFLTDTYREDTLVPEDAAATATALNAEGVTVHVIGRYSNDDINNLPGVSDLSPLATGTGGVYFDMVDGSGSGIPDALNQISDDFTKELEDTSIDIQVDVDGNSEDRIMAHLPINMATSALQIHDAKVSTVADAKAAMDFIRKAVAMVSEKRSIVGTVFNRLDSVSTNLSKRIVNSNSTLSKIEDTDYAVETSEFARSQILSSSAASLIAQSRKIFVDFVAQLLL